jgi:hypothetical protein
MIVCLLMLMVRDDILFVDGNSSPLPSTNKQSSLTINFNKHKSSFTTTINKQTILSHHYHQETNNHLSPLTSLTNNPLTITINKQTIISYQYYQQTNSHLSPLPSTNKQSSLTITINKQTIISHHYHQQTIISHH